MADIRAWHGKTLAQHKSLRDDASAAGYRFISLSLHGSVSEPRYTAVMIKRPELVAQHESPFMTFDEHERQFDAEAEKGFGPVLIAAVGDADDPRFAVVYEKQSVIALTRPRLRSGSAEEPKTFQGMNRKAHLDGLILRSVASYGDADEPRFAAVWVPNPARVTWNADGVLDSSKKYQQRFDAQRAQWARPLIVTMNGDQQHCSVWVDTQVGPFEARHGLTGTEYQDLFDELTEDGYFPACVSGAGEGDDTRYAAIFVKSEQPRPRVLKKTGPRIHNGIDDVMRDILRDTPLRDASLAIVHRGRLVYARGYTDAESGWPVTTPETRFRLLSVSKFVTALAIYQILEERQDAGDPSFVLSTLIQDILGLTTPLGAPPPSPRLADVSVRHLLEHTSGLDVDAYRSELAIRGLWRASFPGKSFSFPNSAARTDAYIAAVPHGAPNVANLYNNTGHYLLGRALAKLRNRATPIAALQEFLFAPLGITRIRLARSLREDQLDDEARYPMSLVESDDGKYLDLKVGKSAMHDDRHLVPVGYGVRQLEKLEGTGGLSAAVTDLARLLAIVTFPGDTPVMRRSTVVKMMDNAVFNRAKWMGRAGHGWDTAAKLSAGGYRAAKGGSLPSSSCSVQVNGDWGVAVCWAGRKIAPYQGKAITASLTPVMNLARVFDWGSIDLFGEYGMPSF